MPPYAALQPLTGPQQFTRVPIPEQLPLERLPYQFLGQTPQRFLPTTIQPPDTEQESIPIDDRGPTILSDPILDLYNPPVPFPIEELLKEQESIPIDDTPKEQESIPIDEPTSQVLASDRGEVSEAAKTVLEPPGSALSGFAHGKETPIKTLGNVSDFKGEQIDATLFENEQGKIRILLHGQGDTSFVDAGVLLRKEKSGVVVENIANNETIKNAIPTLKKIIKSEFGKVIIDKDAPRAQ